MEIRTQRLVLKPLELEYLQTTFHYTSDIENTRYMTNLPNETIEEVREFILSAETEWQKESPSFYEFVILLDNTHIGAVNLSLDESRSTGELGWILDKRYWKKGYGYEAAQAVLNYAIETLGIHHFVAHCDSENTGSFRIMEKLGMHLTDRYPGRQNRSSREAREECRYTLNL